MLIAYPSMELDVDLLRRHLDLGIYRRHTIGDNVDRFFHIVHRSVHDTATNTFAEFGVGHAQQTQYLIGKTDDGSKNHHDLCESCKCAVIIVGRMIAKHSVPPLYIIEVSGRPFLPSYFNNIIYNFHMKLKNADSRYSRLSAIIYSLLFISSLCRFASKVSKSALGFGRFILFVIINIGTIYAFNNIVIEIKKSIRHNNQTIEIILQ